jgi:outer membrane protein TolC
LTRIVQRAIDQNLDLAAALARVEQARAAAKGASARLLPSGALAAQSTFLRQSLESPAGRFASTSPTFDRNQSYLDLGVGASWEVDLFGGLRHGGQAATEEAEAADAEHLGTRISIAAEAADAYIQARGTQARLVFAAEQIGADQRLLQLVSQRRASGIASDREQAQAEAVLAQARSTIPRLAIILSAQLNRLDVLMGAQPGTYAAELSGSADIPVAPAITALADPSDLLRRRPDIIAAERRLAASNARIGQAIAEYYPKVAVTGYLRNEAFGPTSLFRDRNFHRLPSLACAGGLSTSDASMPRSDKPRGSVRRHFCDTEAPSCVRLRTLKTPSRFLGNHNSGLTSSFGKSTRSSESEFAPRKPIRRA